MIKHTTIILLHFSIFSTLLEAIPKRKAPARFQYHSRQRKRMKYFGAINFIKNATENNKLASIKNLLEEHTQVEQKQLLYLPNSEGRFPLEYACAIGSKQIVALLLWHGAPANTWDHMGQSPLLSAIYRGSPNIIRTLITHGAKLNSSKNGPLPLLLATQRFFSNRKTFYNLIEILLEHGADPNLLSHSGISAYMQAATSNLTSILNLMHQYKADPLQVSRRNMSALELSSFSGFTETAKKMEALVSKREEALVKNKLKEQKKDLIDGETLTNSSLSSLMLLNDIVWKKISLMKHVLYKIGTKKGPADPFTNKPIEKEIILRLAAHFGIPIYELTGGQVYLHDKLLKTIASSIVPLEGALSISSCPVISSNLDRYKTKFKKRLELFNAALAQSIYVNSTHST